MSGSVASGDAVPDPICVVPFPLVIAHDTLPAPSPVRTSALRVTVPLSVPVDGDVPRITGFDAAATHATVAVCTCVESGPVARTGTTL